MCKNKAIVHAFKQMQFMSKWVFLKNSKQLKWNVGIAYFVKML